MVTWVEKAPALEGGGSATSFDKIKLAFHSRPRQKVQTRCTALQVYVIYLHNAGCPDRGLLACVFLWKISSGSYEVRLRTSQM